MISLIWIVLIYIALITKFDGYFSTCIMAPYVLSFFPLVFKSSFPFWRVFIFSLVIERALHIWIPEVFVCWVLSPRLSVLLVTFLMFIFGCIEVLKNLCQRLCWYSSFEIMFPKLCKLAVLKFFGLRTSLYSQKLLGPPKSCCSCWLHS